MDKDKTLQEQIRELRKGMEDDSPALVPHQNQELSTVKNNLGEMTTRYNDVVNSEK